VTRKPLAAVALALAFLPIAGGARAGDPTKFDKVGPDQLAFSVANMDLSVDPRADFYRYASGSWLRRVERPERLASLGAFDFMIEHTKARLTRVFTQAAADAPAARKGTPAQLVGDLYRSYTDTARLNALGIRALDPLLREIDAIGGNADLSTFLGRYPTLSGDVSLATAGPSIDQADNTRMSLFLVSGQMILKQEQIYREDDQSPRIAAYLAYVRDVLVLAGWEKPKAEDMAKTALAIERQLQKAKLTPAELVDPRARYNPKSLTELQAAIPELDLTKMIRGAGAEVTDIIVLTEPRYLPVLSTVLKERSPAEIKDYLKLKLIVRFSPYLGEAFEAPTISLNIALAGVAVLPPRSERAAAMAQEYLGHPLSQLYVDAFFPAEMRGRTADMIGRIQAAFLTRMQTRIWLTEATRKAAIEKLQKLSFKVGYPETWIDFSAVEIKPDDLVGNIVRLSQFSTARDIGKMGKPVVPDQFAVNGSTLPVVINAAYNSQINGFEIPAAFLQPPAFDPDRDAASNFCRMGAVIGHEMTHGFDSGGRRFDATGNLRDWWTPDDAAAFDKEAQKLIEQADGFEILPGLKTRGAQEVRENMADVGGITIAYDALLTYLKDHPDEDKAIDGLTAKQRCFVAWTQLWTMKATDQSIRNEVMNDSHPPGPYRAVAAPRHVDGFYEAFKIQLGDPMWLPPEKRVSAW
jgi:putative endopeptidase